MEKMKKVERGSNRIVRETADTYKVVLDHSVAMQERNARFVRSWFESVAGEVRHQAESNREMTEELVERAEKQRGAFQTLVNESVDAYMSLLHAPFDYYKQGAQAVEEVAEEAVEEVSSNGKVPIANYDQLNVEQVKVRTEKLSAAQIRKIRDYEKKHKNRETLIEQFDKKLKATSA